jgi:hypothetical protein
MPGFAEQSVFVEIGDAEFELESRRIVAGRQFYLYRASGGNDVPIRVVFAVSESDCRNDRSAAYGREFVSRTGKTAYGASGFGAGKAPRKARESEFGGARSLIVGYVTMFYALDVFRRGEEFVYEIHPHQDDENGKEHREEDGEAPSV